MNPAFRIPYSEGFYFRAVLVRPLAPEARGVEGWRSPEMGPLLRASVSFSRAILSISL